MPRNSLKNLLGMFPYFLNKNEDSNFTKSQTVTNNMFRDLYQSLRDTYDSFHLEKKCLIYKEQETDFDYTMHFLCNVPLLEHVEIFEDDLLIYDADFKLSPDESYSYLVSENFYEIVTVEIDEETRKISQLLYTNTYDILDDFRLIDYSYDSTSENIIPLNDYRISATTFDEYHYEKGFPENDTILSNVFDHDVSLDEIGAMNNIPRKKYIPATNFARTEPPYNDRLSEDDYHYMQRMLRYNLMLHTHPLPVAEIYKLYGLTAELLSRDRFLVRMFDIFKHGYYYDEETEGDKLYVDDWTPEPWEHKDTLCPGLSDLGEYFFVSANTLRPIKKQKVYFYFDFLNCLAEPLTGDYVVDIYFNGVLLEKDWPDKTYPVDISMLSDSDPNVFCFIGHEGDREIGRWEETIIVRGCNEADFHVKSNGNDNNKGTKENPFKTVEKAVSKVNGIYDLVAVWGSNNTPGNSIVHDDTIIIGCNTGELVNNVKALFFKVNKGQFLIVSDTKFKLVGGFTHTPYDNTYVEYDEFINENCKDNQMNVLMYNVNYGVLINDLSNAKFIKNLNFNTTTGVLTWTEYTLNELLTLNDLKNVIWGMELRLDDDVYYGEYIPVTTDPKLLARPFVYLNDRKGLIEAVETLTYNNTTGILDVYEAGEDIVWQPKSHSI